MTEGPTSATSMWTSEPRQPFLGFMQPTRSLCDGAEIPNGRAAYLHVLADILTRRTPKRACTQAGGWVSFPLWFRRGVASSWYLAAMSAE